jgi:predicted permease
MPVSTLYRDLRYALRQLRKSPGFTVVAVLTLALGIGANTAIYSILHGALRLPYPYADRMMAIQNVYPEASYFSASYPDFEDWRAQAGDFSRIVASSGSSMTWTGAARPESLDINLVSEGFFRLYGMQPVLGRGFLSSEHTKGAAPVCALAEDFWKDQLHGDPAIIGRPINLNGTPCTVVGVVPVLLPSNRRPPQVWMPLEPRPPYPQRGTNYLLIIGLLKPGVTQPQALAELRAIQAQIDKQFPDHKHGIQLVPLSKQVFGDLRPLMLLIQAAVGFILLIACVNLANMLLARATDRAKELAVRRALGASPRRLLQQALTESLLLSLFGAAAGLVIAELLIHIPIAAWPKDLVRPSQVHLDASVLAFTALVAVVTGLLFGLLPALRIVRQDEKLALQQGRTVTESRRQNRTRSALIVAEIALSMLLVAGSLNMVFYFARLMSVNPGINPRHALAMTVSLSPTAYPKPEEQGRFFRAVLDKLSVLPGVTHAAGTLDTPFTEDGSNGDFEYEGEPAGTADHSPFADFHFVTPGYFTTVETPLLEGRSFTPHDNAGSQKVVIINRGMAQRLWPGQSPLGKWIHCCTKDTKYTVIGVAADTHFAGPASPANLTMYLSADQSSLPVLTFILRTRGDPLALVEVARRAVSSIDPGQPLSNITSLDTLAADSVAPQRTSTLITAILGCLALLLAGIGVYGVMAYSVSRREREFGIRMALGANRAGILWLLFLGVSRLVLTGIFLGALLTLAMRTWIASLLGASGISMSALAAATAVLCAMAALATLIPARRAIGVEPMQALRTE